MFKTELSSRDRKDIEKFTRYLIHKYVQTIVQSRQGLRTATRSKQFSSSDWFNLSITDQVEVADAIKAAFSSQPAISLSQPLCIEISLRTTENETMTLEYWCLHTTDKTFVADSSYQVAMTVYSNITMLLKSLITVTRLTPAYRLSRQQSADTYSIRYDIHFEQPTACKAADNCFRRQQVGVVPSPLGAIVAYVVYRTQLSISPQRLAADL
jgi:autophagy-related protein 13